jgi:DNA-directed RNA polymerase alpha subunit
MMSEERIKWLEDNLERLSAAVNELGDNLWLLEKSSKRKIADIRKWCRILDLSIHQLTNNSHVRGDSENLDFLERSVDCLELSKRASGGLKRAGLIKIKDVFYKRPEELLRLRDFGKKSLRQVKAALEEMGLFLPGDE